MKSDIKYIKNCPACGSEMTYNCKKGLAYSVENNKPCRRCSQSTRIRVKTPVEQRFWSKVEKTASCWNWTGYKNYGYGIIRINYENIGTHRYSWELHNGKIPDKLCVLHKCDNPKCVNPDHLFLGTPKDNIDDKVSKMRQCKGEQQHLNKLTEDQVREIKNTPKYFRSNIILSDKYNVTQTNIIGIRQGKIWKHI